MAGHGGSPARRARSCAEAAEAAAQALRRCRAPRNMPIDHFVVLMMENRSFDHYFGWRRARRTGVQDQTLPGPRRAAPCPRATSPRSAAAAWSTRAAATPTRATAGTPAARSSTAASSPRARATTSSRSPTSTSGELGFIHEAARSYTLYDRFFCSLLASTWPNRYYKWSAQSGGLKNNDPPAGRRATSGRRSSTARSAHGLSARYYASDLPFSAVWGPRGATWTQPDHAVLRRLRGRHAAEHRLRGPALPRRRRRRRALGRRAPARRRAPRPGVHGRRGERVRRARRTTGAARCSCIYDEWGGFFDHVHAAERAGRPRERQPGRGLRPDGLPDPGRWRSRRTRAGERKRGRAFRVDHGAVRARVDPQADLATASGSAT